MERALLKICGLREEEVLEIIKGIQDRDGIDIAISENNLDCKIQMKSETLKPIEFQIVKAKIWSAFEDYAYASTDISLPALAAELLKINKRIIAVAESITGGEICSRLCSIPGISENLYEGIVCYSRFSKMARLGVSSLTLAEHGAVSGETAREMVSGLIRGKAPTFIGLATTGLAGPGGDEGKPVGLVYIGVGSGDFITTFEKHIKGERNEIRGAVTNLALFYLIRYLKGDILRL